VSIYSLAFFAPVSGSLWVHNLLVTVSSHFEPLISISEDELLKFYKV